MNTLWAVQIDTAHGEIAYGPFHEKHVADDFAAFLSDEVDPAEVVAYRGGDDLRDPVAELLAWRRMHDAFCAEQHVAELSVRLDECRREREIAWQHAGATARALPYIPAGGGT